ncbi:MAG: aspartate carbamoyltransferase [bacterium]|nr:MAG: aspartate carbamoyltransferase [bacterium]
MAEDIFRFTGRHLIRINDLTMEEIKGLVNTALRFREVSDRRIKKVPTLRGKTVVNLFFEPSIRTRASFEIAGKRLSADFINISAKKFGSSKGETLKDTILNISAMNPDALVIRHSSPGAALYASKIAACPVINAGDGAHSHPTQALLDIMTIAERKKSFEGLSVAIIGDILHSRVARSNIRALGKLKADITLCAPPTLMPYGADTFGVKITSNIEEAVKDADVIMMLRLQRERMAQALFPSLREYSTHFGLSTKLVKMARPDVIIMHPGPINRGVEIAADVADGPYSVILYQVNHGVAMRMAILYLLCGGVED